MAVEIETPKLLEVPKISDPKGSINVLELPFSCNRIYTLEGVPKNAIRGLHAHKELRQIFLVLRGSLTLVCSTPFSTFKFMLHESDTHAVYLPAGYWRVLSNFEPNTTVLVLASDHYDEADYFRDFNDYKIWFTGVVANHAS